MWNFGISDRIIIVKLFRKPFNLSIIQVYALTIASSEEEIGAFYNDLDDAYKQCGSQEMVVVMHCWPDGRRCWLVDHKREHRTPPTSKGHGSG